MSNLQQEYLELTKQLQEVTRRRNEVGELLAAGKAEDTRSAVSVAEKNVFKALIAVGDRGDWDEAKALTGVSDARIAGLFHNALRRVRAANPTKRDKIPSRIGVRTLASWTDWAPYVKRYYKAINQAS